MKPDLDAMTLLDEVGRRIDTRKLYRLYSKTWEDRECEDAATWGPYPRQCEFHALGLGNDYRAILAGTQSGKTRAAAAEIACHLTGWYPPWWVGLRFKKQVEVLACGITSKDTRNIVQKALFGEVDENRVPDGTGWVSGDCIGRVDYQQSGVPNVMDKVRVRHVCGKWSTVEFRSYEQGATKFQGVQFDLCWMDEEPEQKADQEGIFSEIQSRLLVRGGKLIFTRTPLFGATPMVRFFMDGLKRGVVYVNYGIADARHMTDGQKADAMERWPEHERQTRMNGVPMLGEGAVFPVAEAAFVVDPLPIAPHWACICGIDFGIDHDQAAVWLAHDRDTDTVYLYDVYKAKGRTAIDHCAAVKARGDWIPVAWPHDGLNREKGTGRALIELYDLPGKLGCSARWEDDKGGGQSVERAVMEVFDRVKTGRFKVFSTCTAWLEEKRMYHRKDGRIVPVNDDALAASFYGLQMLRFACSKVQANGRNQQTRAESDYDPLASYLRR